MAKIYISDKVEATATLGWADLNNEIKLIILDQAYHQLGRNVDEEDIKDYKITLRAELSLFETEQETETEV